MQTGDMKGAEGATAALAEFASGLRFEMLPGEVVERMKMSLLDGLGCCLHGSAQPWTRMVSDMVLEEGARPDATIFGRAARASIANATLCNATAGHAFESDDIHKESILHPNSLTVPAALAVIEAGDWAADGRDLLTAMAAGYETGIRVGNASTLDLFYSGFHPQGTSGVFCATATAGRLLGLDGARMQQAFGIAGSQAAGLMAAQEGSMVKRLHCGRAAQSGVYAALLARKGFTGIDNVLEAGFGGFLSSFTTKPAPQRLLAGLGTQWETALTGYKLYTCVTSIHTALDALKEIMSAHSLSADAIRRIDVGVSSMTFQHCAWDYQAQGITAAQMNLYYGLAVMAYEGEAFTAQYTAGKIARPELLEFIKRIHVRIDPDIEERGVAFRHACNVDVQFEGGKASRQMLLRRGSAEQPAAWSDIVLKFRKVLAPVMQDADIDNIAGCVASIEKPSALKDLGRILQRVQVEL